jgi:NitT/TauT family transport system permease protein
MGATPVATDTSSAQEAAVPATASARPRILTVAQSIAFWVLPIIGFLATWEFIVILELFNPVILPPPSRVSVAVVEYFTSGVIWSHLAISLRRAATGFALACAVGLPLGILIGWFRIMDRLVGPVIEVFRQLPPLALFPVMIILFGLGFKAQVAIVFWASLWPVLLNTISGTRQTDPPLVKAARSLGCSQLQVFTKVVMPSAIPTISTGLRLGGSYALLVLVAAEMIGANSGIGFLIINGQYNFRIPQMYAAIAILAVLGLIVNYLLVAFERRMTRWRQHV